MKNFTNNNMNGSTLKGNKCVNDYDDGKNVTLKINLVMYDAEEMGRRIPSKTSTKGQILPMSFAEEGTTTVA